jgi:hypothetical protein
VLWTTAQEGEIWKRVAWKNDDRAKEHLEGFQQYEALKGLSLGRIMIEAGSGPWTQSRFLLQAQPNLESTVNSCTVFKPGADFLSRTSEFDCLCTVEAS